jgi:hypothetical protein
LFRDCRLWLIFFVGFPNTSSFTAQLAQMIKFRAAHIAATNNISFGNVLPCKEAQTVLPEFNSARPVTFPFRRCCLN